MAEIAAASFEQAQGIEQISKAVTEMDKVVLQNAANAEESASAAEELNAQAEQMRCYGENLVAKLIDGHRRLKSAKMVSGKTLYASKARVQCNHQPDTRVNCRENKQTGLRISRNRSRQECHPEPFDTLRTNHSKGNGGLDH